MDAVQQLALERMPLAEGVLWLFRLALPDDLLEQIWDEHRGRCYDDLLTFPTLLRVVQDALLQYGSGRESFLKHQQQGTLSTTSAAVYGKLSRLPIPVSQALLLTASRQLRAVFPEAAGVQPPPSLAGFRVLIHDGKAMKRVAKRLKPCRGAAGGLLGGCALTTLDWQTGLALAFHGDADGDANEVKHVGELVPVVSGEFDQPLLHVSDCAFCDLTQPAHFAHRPGDHFLLRYHPKVQFYRDETVPARHSVNELGQPIIETWGWLGGPKEPRRRSVRRIELVRADDTPVILITDLLDADACPARELLEVSRQRWGIEQVFQKVTEVFGLSSWIGCSPAATLFQFSLCLVLYNLIQVARAYIAQAQARPAADISSEMLFRDVERQLGAWSFFIDHAQTVDHFADLPALAVLRQKLESLFANCWDRTWQATPRQAVHRKTPRQTARSHHSIHRILNDAKQAAKAKTKSNTRQRC